jgi:hypothetical protein
MDPAFMDKVRQTVAEQATDVDPEKWCYAVVDAQTEGDFNPAVVVADFQGHFPIPEANWGATREEARAKAIELNAERGVDELEMEAMLVSSYGEFSFGQALGTLREEVGDVK